MISLHEAIYEVGGRTSSVQLAVGQDRLARLARSSRSGNRRREIRRAVVLLGDYASGLLFLVRSRFAANPATLSC